MVHASPPVAMWRKRLRCEYNSSDSCLDEGKLITRRFLWISSGETRALSTYAAHTTTALLLYSCLEKFFQLTLSLIIMCTRSRTTHFLLLFLSRLVINNAFFFFFTFLPPQKLTYPFCSRGVRCLLVAPCLLACLHWLLLRFVRV